METLWFDYSSLSQLKFYLKNQNARFGDLLLEKRIINERSLKNILVLCNNSEKKIGEIVVEQSIISQDQLKELLIEHYTRKKGLFLAENVADVDLSIWVKDVIAS